MEDLHVAASGKCPLCGGNTANGACIVCGYELPDLDTMAAPYDLDPSNDAFGEARSLFETAEIPDISDGGGLDMESAALPCVSAAVNSAGRFASVKLRQIPNIKAAAPQAPPVPQASNQRNAPANMPPSQPPLQNYTPATVFERFVKATADFFAKHWWKFLAVFLAPSSGIVTAVVYFSIFRISDPKKPDMLAKGVLFGALGVFLVSQGFDLFNLDAVLWHIINVILD